MKYSFQKRRHKWNTWWAGRDAESDLVVDLMVCCLHVQFPCPILTLGRLLAPSWPHGEPAPGAIVVDIWEGEKKRHYFFFFFSIFWEFIPRTGLPGHQMCARAGPRSAGGLHSQQQRYGCVSTIDHGKRHMHQLGHNVNLHLKVLSRTSWKGKESVT